MTLRSLALLILFAGCEPTAVLEPAPLFETCAFDSAVFSTQFTERTVAFELGQMVDGGFVPFVDGDEVEMAPAPKDTVRVWYAMGAARLTPLEDLGATVCARLDQVMHFPPGPEADEPTGVLLRRVGDGTWVAPRVPLSLGNLLANGTAAPPEQVKFGPEAGFVRGATQLLRLFQAEVKVQPVNHEGFLSRPKGPPDAGPTPQVNFAVQLQAAASFLRQGEATNVELRLNGERLGEQVDLTVDLLPPGVDLVLQRTAIPGTDTAALAELTSARLVVQPNAAPGPFTLTVTARVGTFLAVGSVPMNIHPAPTQRDLSVSASPAALSLAPGAEGEVLVRLVPFGGFSGEVFIKALGLPEVDVTVIPESVLLTAPTDVVVKVKLLQSDFPNDTTSVQLLAVSGREKWPLPGSVLVTALAPPTPSVYVLSPQRERRVVSPGAAFDWDLGFGTHVALGELQPVTTLMPPTAPAGCTAEVRARGLRLTCDAGFSGAADLAVSAASSAGSGSTVLRLVSSAGVTVMPEVMPLWWDSSRPEVASAGDGTLTVSQHSEWGLHFATVEPDGGVGAWQQVFGNAISLVRTPQGVQRLVLQNRNLSLSGRQRVRDDVLGAFASAVDTDGTVWVAANALPTGETTVRPAVSSSAPGAVTWTARDTGLSAAVGASDLALSVRAGAAVLATVENDVVVVRAFAAGTWGPLPTNPSGAVYRPTNEGRGPERLLALVHDGLARPVVAFIGVDELVHVLRLEGSAWVALSGANGGAGLLPLSLSMGVDPTGRAVLAWHEATHRLVGSSGLRVRPRHVSTSVLRWARLEAAGFVALPPLGMDVAQGLGEQPFVSVDSQGRPVVAFVEDGRVVVQRGPP